MGFVKGMDVSMAKALEAHGASYYWMENRMICSAS